MTIPRTSALGELGKADRSVGSAHLAIAVTAVGCSILFGWTIANVPVPTLAVLALLVAVALWSWQPGLVVLGLLIVCQEIDPSTIGIHNAVLTFGNQVYFGSLSRITLLTAIVTVTAIVCWRKVTAETTKGGLGIVVALGAWTAAVAWYNGASLLSAINQDARFAILFAGAFVIGIAVSSTEVSHRRTAMVLLVGLGTMAVLGVYLFVSGAGIELTNGSRVIFYDSALGAIAGAALLASLASRHTSRKIMLYLGAVALIVVVLSFRRNIWAAVVIAWLVALMVTVTRNRLATASKVVLGAGLIYCCFAVIDSSIVHVINLQATSIWDTVRGSYADTSTHGHVTDIQTGWNAVEHNPVWGVGPKGTLPGLVVEEKAQLYIHNEVLEMWLRYGIVGAALFFLSEGYFVFAALRTLRKHAPTFMQQWAAYVMLIAPVAMISAPFLSTTQRWPTLLGLAAGILGRRNTTSVVSMPRNQKFHRRVDVPLAT
jgi:O-antigen ligase